MSAKNTYLTRAGARDLTKRIWNRKFLYLLFLPVALNLSFFTTGRWRAANRLKRYNIVLGLGRSRGSGWRIFKSFSAPITLPRCCAIRSF